MTVLKPLSPLLALGLLVGVAGPAGASAGDDSSSRIAFTRADSKTKSFSLWTARPDGSHRIRVVNGEAFFPAWSPDRKRLLFDFPDAKGNEQIAIVRVYGTHRHQLTHLRGISEAADYAPNGKTIVFDRSPRMPDDPKFFVSLWVMRSDGSHPHPLFKPDPAKFDNEPKFSPDGSQIVFGRIRVGRDGKQREAVFVVDRDGTHERQLTRFTDGLEHPRWSPDGRNIVFDVTHDQRSQPGDGIYLVGADGHHLRRIFNNDRHLRAFKPDFSPDGARILFGCFVTASMQDDLCVMNANGSNVRRITRTPHIFENYPLWN